MTARDPRPANSETFSEDWTPYLTDEDYTDRLDALLKEAEERVEQKSPFAGFDEHDDPANAPWDDQMIGIACACVVVFVAITLPGLWWWALFIRDGFRAFVGWL